jgi:hypothetical protein
MISISTTLRESGLSDRFARNELGAGAGGRSCGGGECSPIDSRIENEHSQIDFYFNSGVSAEDRRASDHAHGIRGPVLRPNWIGTLHRSLLRLISWGPDCVPREMPMGCMPRQCGRRPGFAGRFGAFWRSLLRGFENSRSFLPSLSSLTFRCGDAGETPPSRSPSPGWPLFGCGLCSFLQWFDPRLRCVREANHITEQGGFSRMCPRGEKRSDGSDCCGRFREPCRSPLGLRLRRLL